MKVVEELINEDEFRSLKDDDLLFITYPGRMGDVMGCSFVIRKDNEIHFYRIDDLVKFKENIFEKFTKWDEALKKYSEKLDPDKYKIIYMGMGNLLGVDKTIFDDFKAKVDEKVPEISDSYNDELKFGMACYTYWREIVYDMFMG